VTDGGSTWTAAVTPFVGVGFFDLVVDPRPSILYGATTDDSTSRTNRGASWTASAAGKCWNQCPSSGGSVEVLAGS